MLSVGWGRKLTCPEDAVSWTRGAPWESAFHGGAGTMFRPPEPARARPAREERAQASGGAREQGPPGAGDRAAGHKPGGPTSGGPAAASRKPRPAFEAGFRRA